MGLLDLGESTVGPFGGRVSKAGAVLDAKTRESMRAIDSDHVALTKLMMNPV